jgi:hypothetical protein
MPGNPTKGAGTVNRIFVLALALVLGGAAAAAPAERMPFEDMVKRSDVVMFAQIALVSSDETRAEVEPVSMLKGDQGLKKIVVRLRPGKNEDDCCRKYRKYLMFLRKLDNGEYESANGKFGFIDVD